jgi:putative ABC transport system permease protein
MSDLRFGIRALLRSPGFTVVAVLALALGIGANTAVFTIVNSVLLRPLPFPEAERLYALSAVPEGNPFLSDQLGLPDGLYLEFHKQDRSFEKLAAFQSHRVTMTGAGDAQSVRAAFVTADFFSVLRARAAVGRTFYAGEDQAGHDSLVVIGDSLWRSVFNADPAIVGKSVRLDGDSHTVIGVMPAGFAFPAALDLWVPQSVHLNEHNSMLIGAIGKMKPGVSPSQVAAELDTVMKRIPGWLFGEEGSRRRPPARVVPLLRYVSGRVQRSLLVFLGAVAFVLLIACANAANLMLARAAGRRQEIAVRAALGASRWRLIRQLLTESTLVALAGGAGGLVLALWIVPALIALAPEGTLPRVEQIGIDGWVLVFTFAISLITGLGFGILPACQATRTRLQESLGQSGRSLTGRHERLRGALVISEIALALVLLTGAGLMLKSLLRLRAGETGFQPENVITMSLDLPDNVYQKADQIHSFQERTLEKLRQLPGVSAAAVVNWLPFGGQLTVGDFQLEGGRPFPSNYMVDKPVVSSDYFHAMGIRLVRGRDFQVSDNAHSARVAIASQSAAQRLWPGENAIGKRFSEGDNPKPEDWVTVVGVADDVKQLSMADRRRDAMYQPLQQITSTGWLSQLSFVVRTASDPELLATAMRSAVRDVDRNQPVRTIATMQTLIDVTMAEPRFQTRLLGAFSMLALLLASVGVYGVLAYSVTQRTHEIGIRMALGAEAGNIRTLVLRRTLALTGAGIVIGAAGALAVTRVLQKFLFEVKPSDPATFLAGALLLSAIALTAGWIPARRATRVDPMVALRHE